MAFAIDVSLELGVAGGVLHLPAMLLALRLPRLRDALLFAGLCTALVLLAWGLSPHGGEGWKVATNRSLAIAAIWVVAGLGPAQWRGEDLFRHALESTPMGVMLVDAKGCVAMANERAQHVFGYTAAELIGLEIAHLMPPRFREAHRTDEARFRKGRVARTMGGDREILGLHQDGREIPLEIGLAPVRRRGQPLMLVSVVDASQRSQANERMRQEHKRVRDHLQQQVEDLRALVERGGGLALVTLDGRLRMANPEASRLLALDLRSDGVARLPVPLLRGESVLTTIDRGEPEPTFVQTRAVPTTWGGEAALAITVEDATEAHQLRQRMQLLDPGEDPSSDRIQLAGRVLVVDDEVTVLELACSRLAATGLGVLAAHDGREALEHLQQRGPFDVLVTDLVMPGIDGLELAAEAARIQPGIEVLVISGHGPEVLAEYSLDREAVHFLGKPFRLVELVRAVGGLLDQRRRGTGPGRTLHS